MEESVKRYILESFWNDYSRAGKKEKGDILDKICRKFYCHRKHAIRLMKSAKFGSKPRKTRRGRKSKYDQPDFIAALSKVRRVMEFRNVEVMKENMAEWLPGIQKYYGEFSPEVRGKLLSISASTMKRIFRRIREEGLYGLSTTRPSSLLRTEIPIRTESFWDESVPGKMAADTVAHCGTSTQGQYINTLDMVCPVTHWTAQRALWGKGSHGVLEETKDIEKSLPFRMIGLHVDNGSEFLNYAYIRHFTDEHTRQRFQFTRSRANHKNGRVKDRRGNFRPVSYLCSSNRTCSIAASGSL